MTTAIIAIRNRYDYRLTNALESLKRQTVPCNILIVDYGSDEEYEVRFMLLETYPKGLLGEWTGTKNKWNKSHALNIGIKGIETEYVLITDVDVILEPNYIEECEKAMKNNKQVLYAPMLDLKEGEVTDVIKPEDFYALRDKARYRGEIIAPNSDFPFGSSIIFAKTSYLKEMNGYDEYYTLWGAEDRDMIKRLGLMGIPLNKVNSSHIHQWHPKYEGVKDEPNFEEVVKKNHEYLEMNDSIKRNLNGWGKYENPYSHTR